MIFAEFYQMDTGYMQGSIPPIFDENNRKPTPACGDRSVVVLDGRHTLETNKEIATTVCKERGYIGFRLYRGGSLLRNDAITKYIGIED